MSETEGLQQITTVDPKPNDAAQPGQKMGKKRRHPWRMLGLIIVILILLGALVAGWFGLIPGVSSLLGANKARDLRVQYTAADLVTYQEKTVIQFLDYANAPENPNKPGKKMIFGNPKTVEGLAISQEELTAAVNSLNWRTMPLRNVQIRAGNGIVEVSGNLNAKNIAGFIKFIGGVGYSQGDVDKAASWAMRLVNNAPVYVNASVSAENDQLSFILHEAKVGRLAIPQGVAEKVLRVGLTSAITNADNYEIKSASFSNGQMNFSGTYPTTVYVAH